MFYFILYLFCIFTGFCNTINDILIICYIVFYLFVQQGDTY